jgi:two-component system sensor histidine kinase KdpD
LTRELSKTSGIDQVCSVSSDEIKKYFALESHIIPRGDSDELPEYDQLKPKYRISFDEYSVANHAFKSRRKAGRFTGEFRTSGYCCYPLPGTMINPGIVMLKQENEFNNDVEVFWDTFLAQISNALEREFLAELARRARFLDESDRFYKTLFNSVSHELRIPVATILAASDAMLEPANPDGMHSALSKEIYTASLRLNRLIENLLNMSRLESGRIAVRLDWYDLNDLVYKVINDLEEELKAFSIKVTLQENLPLVRIDFGLMEQVLYNLIFNACQYAPATSEINISAEYTDGSLVIRVMDRGPGFPPEALANVFNKFYRADEKGTGGLGLGLSIVKGFAEAHQGFVKAENRPEGGAVVTVAIPSEIPDITDLSMEKSDA